MTTTSDPPSGTPRVHIVWHPSSLAHDPGPGHPESPARLHAILDALRSDCPDGRCVWVEATKADDAALGRVHDAGYLAQLEAMDLCGGGMLDGDTTMSPASLDAARHGAGAAVEAALLALTGRPAFAAVRPPGHHATAKRAMGFCLINNVVVAARAVIDGGRANRVLIIDWDVHHGNGTQALVEGDDRIRYVSMHQWPHYPGTGGPRDLAPGNIFNLPRPPGLSRETYVSDLDDAVRRAVDGWLPDLILISAGFDAMSGDPLAGFTLEPEDYACWIEGWRGMGVPIASVLEGGYVPRRIAAAATAMVGALQ